MLYVYVYIYTLGVVYYLLYSYILIYIRDKKVGHLYTGTKSQSIVHYAEIHLCIVNNKTNF